MPEEETQLADKFIDCADCGQTFRFSVGEQQYYKEKGLTHPPKRCKSCRDARRQARSDQG